MDGVRAPMRQTCTKGQRQSWTVGRPQTDGLRAAGANVHGWACRKWTVCGRQSCTVGRPQTDGGAGRYVASHLGATLVSEGGSLGDTR